MNKHVQELVELSRTDKEIDSYQPKIDALDQKIDKAASSLDDAQKRLTKVNNIIAQNEQKVASYEEQLKTLNEQLSSNAKKTKSIVTEREMKALAIEEDIAKEKMSFANEEISRLQLVNEKKAVDVTTEEEGLATLQAELDAITAKVNKERVTIENSKVKLFTSREKSIREIDQNVLSFYEKIRIWAGNTVVVPVKKQACYGCYIKLNDKTYADVIKGDEIKNCPHCGRILYIERETAEA